MGRLLSVNVGTPLDFDWRGRMERSGIDKRPVAGSVAVGRLGLAGDVRVDTTYHGGPEQAVYAYAVEDLGHWSELLGRRLTPGTFGENLTLDGVDVTGTPVGTRWRVGSVLLEVCSVRTPCRTFQSWLREPAWVRRFAAEGRPGAYLRVLEEGGLRAGDEVEVVETRDHGVTVGMMLRALTTDRSLLPRLLVEPRVHPKARERAERYLRTATATSPAPRS